jgi:hypothetical protein
MSDNKTPREITFTESMRDLDANINPSTLSSNDDDYQKAHGKRRKTAGEIVFDRTVYTGIGFGVNEGSALVIADEFEHGMGKNLFQKTANWLVKTLKFGEKVTREGKKITPHENASNALLTFSLLLSGTALVWPMKWLEDHKASLVKKANHQIDNMRGNKLSGEEVKARDNEVEQALACEPKQSWPSLLVGRTIAVSSTMVNSMFVMGPNGMRKAGNFSENLLTKGKLSIDPVPGNGKPRTRAQRYAYVTGIETVCCVISSIVLESASKLFARTRKKKLVHDPELCDEVKAAPLSQVTESSETDNRDEKLASKKFANDHAPRTSSFAEKAKSTQPNTENLEQDEKNFHEKVLASRLETPSVAL